MKLSHHARHVQGRGTEPARPHHPADRSALSSCPPGVLPSTTPGQHFLQPGYHGQGQPAESSAQGPSGLQDHVPARLTPEAKPQVGGTDVCDATLIPTPGHTQGTGTLPVRHPSEDSASDPHSARPHPVPAKWEMHGSGADTGARPTLWRGSPGSAPLTPICPGQSSARRPFSHPFHSFQGAVTVPASSATRLSRAFTQVPWSRLRPRTRGASALAPSPHSEEAMPRRSPSSRGRAGHVTSWAGATGTTQIQNHQGGSAPTRPAKPDLPAPGASLVGEQMGQAVLGSCPGSGADHTHPRPWKQRGAEPSSLLLSWGLIWLVMEAAGTKPAHPWQAGPRTCILNSGPTPREHPGGRVPPSHQQSQAAPHSPCDTQQAPRLLSPTTRAWPRAELAQSKRPAATQGARDLPGRWSTQPLPPTLMGPGHVPVPQRPPPT